MDRGDLRIDDERLHASLADLAAIGATPGGGVTRLALSDEDRAARDLLQRWMTDAGLAVRVDDFGNMTGRRAGPRRRPAGAHRLRTSIPFVSGGRYDGAYGVLGALEAIAHAERPRHRDPRPLELVNWTNEEGVRFEPAMTCRRGRGRASRPTRSTAEPTATGCASTTSCAGSATWATQRTARPGLPPISNCISSKGRVLEAAELPVGVVDGIVGITWSEVVDRGPAPITPDPARCTCATMRCRRPPDRSPESNRCHPRTIRPPSATVGRIAAEAECHQHDSWPSRLQRRFSPSRARHARSASRPAARGGRQYRAQRPA